MPSKLTDTVLNTTVIVTTIGYLVDMYDFIIFNVTRVQSLSDLHLSGDALTKTGIAINNWQLLGILIGSYLWGTLGDKYGRKTSLFASIFIYSLATLACSVITDANAFAGARFFAGLGVAGELGVGLALISEKMSAARRGYCVMIFIVFGFIGVLSATLAAQTLPWRTTYVIGGVAGLILLMARIFVLESGLFQAMSTPLSNRGGLKIILTNPLLRMKYIASIFYWLHALSCLN